MDGRACGTPLASAHIAGREPPVRQHAGAAVGATHERDGLSGRQQRRFAVALALLELLAALDDVALGLHEQPRAAQQPDVAVLERLDDARHHVELRESQKDGV